MKTEIEFEIVCKPSEGKPGIMRVKQAKSLEDQLVEACKKAMINNFGGYKTLADACRTVINSNYNGILPLVAPILLEMEAEKKDPSKVYMSEVYIPPQWTEIKADYLWAKSTGKKYVLFQNGDVYNLDDKRVCCSDDITDDTEEM
jgi:hypothetical protein